MQSVLGALVDIIYPQGVSFPDRQYQPERT